MDPAITIGLMSFWLRYLFSMRTHALPFITKLALLFQVGFIVLEEWHIKVKVT